MKEYGRTWCWGKDGEYMIDACIHWSKWALPLVVNWWYFEDALYNKYYSVDVSFLCFHFGIEIWRLNK